MKASWSRALLILLPLVGIFLPQVVVARTYQQHPGYLSTTVGERQEVVEDMVVFTPPAPDKPPLKDRIFNEKLSREFTDRYEEKFGRTEQQRAYLAPNHTTYYNDLFGFRGTAIETDNEKRKFGEFMVKRLAEFHVENYAKTDPKARVVWEAKEKMSNVKMSVGKQVKISVKYALSGNYADINIQNPWVQSKITLHMGGSLFEETIISLSRGITRTISAESHYAMTDGVVSFIARKTITPLLSTSLTTSTFTNHTGKSRRESIYLTGLSYTY